MQAPVIGFDRLAISVGFSGSALWPFMDTVVPPRRTTRIALAGLRRATHWSNTMA